jgi:ubiquinone/menaquinone biosynthesis C-methylase UbiE
MLSSAGTRRSTSPTGVVLNALAEGLHAGLDRMLSVAYGAVYDSIFDRFTPYQALQREVLDLVETTQPQSSRRDVRVLEIGCGPGNFAFTLALSGFTVVGIDPYPALVELAREKRRAKRLQNLSFRPADLAGGDVFSDDTFDQVVNIHSLYTHAAPHRLLREAFRVLKPGGHAVFVNPAHRLEFWPTLRQAQAEGGLRRACESLLWVLPNSIFEATRRRVGPHYWDEAEFATCVQQAGFTVLATHRTFFDGASVLVWARKDDH